MRISLHLKFKIKQKEDRRSNVTLMALIHLRFFSLFSNNKKSFFLLNCLEFSKRHIFNAIKKQYSQ